MLAFAQTCATVAKTDGTLEKVALIAAYLRALDEPDLIAAARFFAGDPLGGGGAPGLGRRTLLRAAHAVWRVDDAALLQAYRRTGVRATRSRGRTRRVRARQRRSTVMRSSTAR